MRVLGALRLSHVTDESTSIERQRGQVTYGSKARSWDLVHITEDSDVSGAVSPFDREGLGPWLTDPELIPQWDVLMVPKLDRLTRSLRDFDDTRLWCDQHGKTIVSIAESLDLSTSVGRMFANLLAMFAQFERERMAERRAEAAQRLMQDGRLNSGDVNVRYGYRRGADGRPELEPGEANVIKLVSGWLLDGVTLSAACDRLEADGIPTRRGKRWHTTTISRIFADLDEPYARAADGTPYFMPEVIPHDDLLRVREALSSRAFTLSPKASTTRKDSALLLQVAFCPEGHPLYALRSDERRQYYRCHKCPAVRCRMDKLEAVCDWVIHEAFGEMDYAERRFIPGTGHAREIADIERRMADIEAQVVNGFPAASAARVLATLDARRAELGSIEVTPGEWRLVRTGEKVRDVWDGGNPDRRRKLLREIELKLSVWKDDGRLRVGISYPAMLVESWIWKEEEHGLVLVALTPGRVYLLSDSQGLLVVLAGADLRSPGLIPVLWARVAADYALDLFHWVPPITTARYSPWSTAALSAPTSVSIEAIRTAAQMGTNIHEDAAGASTPVGVPDGRACTTSIQYILVWIYHQARWARH